MSGRTVYFERTLLGGLARVCAIDSLTAKEAIVFGPATLPPADLEALALRKLEMLLAQSPPPPPQPPRRGKLV